MAITTKNRKQLKSYFVKNAIPTEGNFSELVDASLIQAEDGVFKLPGEPLSVVAAPGEQKRALRFYTNYPAPNPDWLISLSPAQDPANPASIRPGFGVTDGAGNTRLYIDPATGNVGVGTTETPDKLTVAGGDIRIQGGYYRRLKVVSDEYWAGIELVARNKGAVGYPHIDFTTGDLDNPNYGVRLVGVDNKVLQVESNGVPVTLSVRGDVTYDGTLNKLDTREQFSAIIRAADLHLGFSARRGKTCRALVDAGDALVVNFNSKEDWPRTIIGSPLAVNGSLGVGNHQPGDTLEVRVPGVGGWNRLVVTADTAWGNGNAHVSIGSGAGGIMIHNPHVVWNAGEGRASIRFAHSGGNANGMWWDVGARPGNAFSFAANGGDHRLWLTGDGRVGINCTDPGGQLDVRVPGTGGWDRFVVTTTKFWGDGETQFVTIGAGGAGGIMINNPHIPWIGGPNGRASIRFGRSGGVQEGSWWDLGVRANNMLTISRDDGPNALTIDAGNKVTVAGLEIGGSATLGFATRTDDFNAPLRSGFYERDNPAGRVPDTAHPWVHMINVRHSNANNHHALQIAASYAQNDRLFFRKVARELSAADNPWHEVATAASVPKIRIGFVTTNFNSGSGERLQTVAVNFGYTFASPPQVLVLPKGWDTQHDRNERLDMWPESVTTTGCVIRFKTWGDTLFWWIGVNWIAIGF